MNKLIKKELTKIINDCSGKLLGIGLNDRELLKKIENNKKIVVCDLLSNNAIGINNKKVESSKGKNISIKSLKRIFGKKKINNIICDYQHIEKYLKTFVKDSIYITKGSITIYGKISTDDVNSLINKYKRYNIQAEITKENDNYLIRLEIGKCKTNKIKDGYYWLIDEISDLGEIISDLLVG